MKLLVTGLLTLALTSTGHAAGLERHIPGLAMGADTATLIARLNEHCETRTAHRPAKVGFPLASDQEEHFVCAGLRLVSGERIDRAVFTAADDALVHVELRGGVSTLSESAEPDFAYGPWQAYMDDLLVVRPKADTAYYLTAEGLHANLQAWPNPLFDNGALVYQDVVFQRPKHAQFGAELAALSPALESHCAPILTRDLTPGLPTQPKTQTQIDCFGYEVAGFPRKIEFVFGDGKLELMWILSGRGEENRLRDALTAELGPAFLVTDDYEVFGDGGIALRKDKPEILMLSPRMAELFAQ